MNEKMVVAIVFILFVLIIMWVSIHKSGVDGGIKIWGAIGTLCGAIVSYYFTSEIKNDEIEEKNADLEFVHSQLDASIERARDARGMLVGLQGSIAESPDASEDDPFVINPRGAAGAVARPWTETEISSIYDDDPGLEIEDVFLVADSEAVKSELSKAIESLNEILELRGASSPDHPAEE